MEIHFTRPYFFSHLHCFVADIRKKKVACHVYLLYRNNHFGNALTVALSLCNEPNSIVTREYHLFFYFHLSRLTVFVFISPLAASLNQFFHQVWTISRIKSIQFFLSFVIIFESKWLHWRKTIVVSWWPPQIPWTKRNKIIWSINQLDLFKLPSSQCCWLSRDSNQAKVFFDIEEWLNEFAKHFIQLHKVETEAKAKRFKICRKRRNCF